MAVELSPPRLCSSCSSREAAAQIEACAEQAHLDMLATPAGRGGQLLTLSGSRLIRVKTECLLCLLCGRSV